ncbi:MAG: UDP-glucuronic acid decarboxylase family protein [Nanoarchaeota archaeon]
MKKVLVTGGAGFIGNHLCRFLLEKGYYVVCLDNFFTGRRENVRSLLWDPRFKIISHDITSSLIPIKEQIGSVDEIYNLACPASPVHYQFDPIETIQANTIGVINVLEFARLNGATVLQASTSETYGDPLEHPQKESYRGNVNAIGPRACYDEGKRVAETLFFDYHRKYGLPIRVARIFNTYGPNMYKNDGRVVSNFIMQALNNVPITIYGNGNQTRSFCYVEDLIDGLYRLMNSNYVGPVNLGNPGEFTMLELAKKVIDFTNSKSEFVHKELPIDDPLQRKPDISLAKSVLNWEPKINLDEGLKKTIMYFSYLPK